MWLFIQSDALAATFMSILRGRQIRTVPILLHSEAPVSAPENDLAFAVLAANNTILVCFLGQYWDYFLDHQDPYVRIEEVRRYNFQATYSSDLLN